MVAKYKIFEKYIIFVQLQLLVIILMLFGGGCTGNQEELLSSPDVLLVWPQPPEKPRVRYIGTISTEADLEKQVSWTEGLGELLFGKEKIGVLVAPYAVTVDRYGRLFAADTTGGVVHAFDLNTRAYKQFADIDEQKKLSKPVGLTIVDDWVYVVDSALREVCVFDGKGKFRGRFGSERLVRPSGIAYYSEQDELYVSDTGGHVVNVFNKSGDYIRTIGSRGIEPGQFNFPTHLWVDKSGKLYVSDTLNYRVQVFSSQGEFLHMFGEHGDHPGNFAHPCGIATDSFGNIYVTDRQFENVQIFDQQGRILMAFGQEGKQAGQFWLPGGIFVDRRNRIYVADTFNKRIQIFELMK
ncbi:MAG: 6-bladed beta-propeller [Sedimentisphaerales bacterium]|nr:6-bladed beta-propeller [Sedimentisphaerales bacterium]